MSCESYDKANCEPPSHLYLSICRHMFGVSFRVNAGVKFREIGVSVNCAVILMIYCWVQTQTSLLGESTTYKINNRLRSYSKVKFKKKEQSNCCLQLSDYSRTRGEG